MRTVAIKCTFRGAACQFCHAGSAVTSNDSQPDQLFGDVIEQLHVTPIVRLAVFARLRLESRRECSAQLVGCARARRKVRRCDRPEIPARDVIDPPCELWLDAVGAVDECVSDGRDQPAVSELVERGRGVYESSRLRTKVERQQRIALPATLQSLGRRLGGRSRFLRRPELLHLFRGGAAPVDGARRAQHKVSQREAVACVVTHREQVRAGEDLRRFQRHFDKCVSERKGAGRFV
mmetsp:Transcript_7810/g.18247  ORF Transcript_7810/g.18247 Transcript_7810/m.18247 type:complete len:235 (+) Transcript_7810:160-864(+)